MLYTESKIAQAAFSGWRLKSRNQLHQLQIHVNITLTSRGQVEDGLHISNYAGNAGDTENNVGLQGFVTYDLSGIPDSATILTANIQNRGP